MERDIEEKEKDSKLRIQLFNEEMEIRKKELEYNERKLEMDQIKSDTQLKILNDNNKIILSLMDTIINKIGEKKSFISNFLVEKKCLSLHKMLL